MKREDCNLLQTRLERAAHGLGNRCSIHLSYWSIIRQIFVLDNLLKLS